ncbi:IS110 family transposase [Sporosarcina trichiuri]|uniref:IS110 family transposase n=1 Tax=Sporosarcina trichiuri TaxID=3056445 RepID=UPI0025B4860F|nr:IS110 family transposase [Sporosarcina sp. 0.2-SM1T-5]WJY26273.1 IS110 family transposase [Sporosarcina sp. 0.2-SM1T-5]WJY26523.1 IS110 family transposase [Sporosarcina sp. 0.2-SM1T-5]WJY26562.1 IS110 family transposase [Sporosarcina sp. 0.2-SM1T-5]WJY27170.1 IS110 family transposase [Sporosarcina sp. 0.2-SM1T-5]
MNDTQNHKIMQVTEQTLIVGIDVAKEKHYACMVNDRGIVLKKPFPVFQSRQGFDFLQAEIQNAMKEFGKTDVLVGAEPTGHYGLNLRQFLHEQHIPFVAVQTLHVKRSKELDDNIQTKNDKKDAIVIAKLVKDGRYSYPRHLKDHEADIRVGSTLRNSLVKERTALQNKLIRWTDVYFPEFRKVFGSFGKMALAVLTYTPFPADFEGKSLDDLRSLYRQSDGLRSVQMAKVKKLIPLLSHTIGASEGQRIARLEIQSLVSRFRQVERELAELEDALMAIIRPTDEYEILNSVPGISDSTIIDLLSEVGSFTHYKHPRQLEKLAGLMLRESSSGKHTGQKRLSKRGRRRLRSVLYRVTLPLVQHNPAFRQLHLYYTTRLENPLKKKESMVVLCRKLLHVLFGMCKHRRAFDPQRMIQDIPALAQG